MPFNLPSIYTATSTPQNVYDTLQNTHIPVLQVHTHDPADNTNGVGAPIPNAGSTHPNYATLKTLTGAAVPADPSLTQIDPTHSVLASDGIIIHSQMLQGFLAQWVYGNSQTPLFSSGSPPAPVITAPQGVTGDVTAFDTNPTGDTSTKIATVSGSIASSAMSVGTLVNIIDATNGNETVTVIATTNSSGNLATFSAVYSLAHTASSITSFTTTGQQSGHITLDGIITGAQIASSIPSGTAPVKVVSTTYNPNLNSHMIADQGGATWQGIYGSTLYGPALTQSAGYVNGGSFVIAADSYGLNPVDSVQPDFAEQSSPDVLALGQSTIVNSLNRLRFYVASAISSAAGLTGSWDDQPTSLVTAITSAGQVLSPGDVDFEFSNGLIATVDPNSNVISVQATATLNPVGLTPGITIASTGATDDLTLNAQAGTGRALLAQGSGVAEAVRISQGNSGSAVALTVLGSNTGTAVGVTGGTNQLGVSVVANGTGWAFFAQANNTAQAFHASYGAGATGGQLVYLDSSNGPGSGMYIKGGSAGNGINIDSITGAGAAYVGTSASTNETAYFNNTGTGRGVIADSRTGSGNALGVFGNGTNAAILVQSPAGGLTLSLFSNTSGSASPGSNGNVPVQVVEYITIQFNGALRKIPLYGV